MPVETRSSTAKMEGTLKEMMDMMRALKVGQEEMKGDMNKQLEDVKTDIGDMKGNVSKQFEDMKTSQEEMKRSQEVMKGDINKQLEDMKEDIRSSQDNIKLQLDEQGKKIDQQVSNMKIEIDNKFENMEKIVEETVKDFKKEIGEGMDDIKKEMGDMKKEISREIDDIKEEMCKLKSKSESLQNRGIVVKPEECNQSSARIKPPTYDGKTSWQTYMKQFDAAAGVNNWTESEKATALIVSLRGEALEILQTLSEDRHKNYEQLVLHLEMRFGDKHLQQVYQAQLKGRVQRSNETLQQYEADIARLVYLAYPTAPSEFIEQLAVQVFIDGIRDCETQQALRLARCKKINEVLAYALEFEAAKHASRGYTRVRQIRSQTPDQRSGWRSGDRVTWKDEIEHLTKEITEKLTTLQDKVHERKQGTTYGRRRSLECWNCGEQGHIRSRCPRLGREATAQPEEENQENSN